MPTGANATTLGTLEGLLPKPIAKKILVNAYKESVIGRLSGTDPMPITGSSIAFQTGKPVAGVGGEGGLKPRGYEETKASLDNLVSATRQVRAQRGLES